MEKEESKAGMIVWGAQIEGERPNVGEVYSNLVCAARQQLKLHQSELPVALPYVCGMSGAGSV